MKTRTFIILTLLLTSLSLSAANISGGTTLYLDATKWNSYTIFSAYFWSNTSDGNYVAMTAVSGVTDTWQVTAPAGSWTNVIFRAHNASISASGTGWGSNVAIQTVDLTYDGTKDMYVPANGDNKGGGKWSVFVMPCETQHITFDTIVCTSVLPVTWRGFTFTEAGVQTTSVPHTNPLLTCDSILTSYVLITRNCSSDIIHDTLKLCIDSAAATLTPTTTGDAYEWSTGATTQSISVTPSKVGVQEYTCRVGQVGTPQLDKNIILNGGFEDTTHTTTNYTGFTSDYEFHAPYQKFNYSKSYRGFYKLTDSEYYGTNPHTGKFMMICDGDENRKEAWSANTTEPIIRGKQYRFSFWAANAFSGSTQEKFCPKLSFYIEMNGKTYELVPEVTLPADVNWHQYGQTLSWTAPESAVQARVFLVDNCLQNDKNDFSLDDIVFQPLFGEDSQTTEVFPVKVDSCTTPEPPVPPVDPCEGFQTKTERFDTIVCDTLLTGVTPYIWREHEFTKPDSVSDTIPSLIGCGDSIITIYRLDTIHCERPTPPTPPVDPCEGFQTKTERFDTIVCDTLLTGVTPYIWRGKTFTKPDSFSTTIPSKIGCGDSIITIYRLDTVHCEHPTPPEPPVTCLENLVYAKWTNFLFCDNSKLEFTAYQWYCNDVPMSGQTKQYLYLEAGMGQAQYVVEVTRTDGTTAKTCPTTFDETPRSADTYDTPSVPRRIVVPLGAYNLIVVFDENDQPHKLLQQR